MAGRALSEKEHGVFSSHWIGIVDLAEQIARMRELRFEFGENFFTNGVTAEANARTDGGDQVLRAGAEGETHGPDAGFDDTLDCSAPAGMKGGDGALLAIGNQHGNAVGGLNGEEQAGFRGHLSVSPVRMGAPGVGADGVDDEVGVELTERDERRCGIGCNGLGEETPVAMDSFAIVDGGKTEVQLARQGGQTRGAVIVGTPGAVSTAQATLARGEACPKPGKVPAGDREPLDAVGCAERNRWRSRELFGSVAFELGIAGRTRFGGAWAVGNACTRKTEIDCLKG